MNFKSCAKINLSLEIKAPRADGFNAISSLMQSISLCDQLDFEECPQGFQLLAPLQVPQDSDNIISKAVELFAGATNVLPAYTIRLSKNIPVGAGLGGGSSNAATTLLALNQLLETKLDLNTLSRMAGSLGCDVPFFLHQGLAWAQGKGEILTPLPHSLPFYVILLYPGFPIQTAWAYQQFARHGIYGEKHRIAAMLNAVSHNDFMALCAALYNDFEPVMFELFPQLQILKTRLQEAGCEGALMSGSGSCLFGLVREQAEAEAVFAKIKGLNGVQAFLARSF
jgi:4-diphosphocytidyl-2-C-methyl-D-erythritol kinase